MTTKAPGSLPRVEIHEGKTLNSTADPACPLPVDDDGVGRGLIPVPTALLLTASTADGEGSKTRRRCQTEEVQ